MVVQGSLHRPLPLCASGHTYYPAHRFLTIFNYHSSIAFICQFFFRAFLLQSDTDRQYNAWSLVQKREILSILHQDAGMDGRKRTWERKSGPHAVLPGRAVHIYQSEIRYLRREHS